MKQYKINFFKNRKKFFAVSISILLIGLVFNIIFGTQLDMQFTGGAVINYSYSGSIDETEVDKIVTEKTGKSVSVRLNESLDQDSQNSVTLSFAGTDSLPLDQQKLISESLAEKYPDSNFTLVESSSIDASMGRDFFYKCLICVGLATILLIIYIAIRFKKIGGASAGVMAIVALLHDIAMVYFTFIIFRIPLNDNFIAVVLTILGYSLNDTIVIYDRIRENRRNLGPKAPLAELVNLSINQTLSRSIHTSVSTFISIAVVYIVGLIYNLPTITTFALPMMVGVVTGCYSSICIAGPLYVMWQERKKKVKTA